MSQALATNDGEQIALLARYEKALARRREKEKWIGPPGRDVLLEPLQERIYALAKLSRSAQEEFKPSGTRRGKFPVMARGAWQVEYAKICWRCIRAEFGDEKAFAAVKSAFLEFIRAMAEFASGNRIETGFGGAVRQALAWASAFPTWKREPNNSSMARYLSNPDWSRSRILSSIVDGGAGRLAPRIEILVRSPVLSARGPGRDL